MTAYLPTLKQLQYLVALHEHGHFGRAVDADGGFSWERIDLVEDLKAALG